MVDVGTLLLEDVEYMSEIDSRDYALEDCFQRRARDCDSLLKEGTDNRGTESDSSGTGDGEGC